MNPPPLHAQLGVTEADLVILLGQAKRFAQSRQEMETQVRVLNTRLKAEGKEEKDILEAVHQVDLAYRYKLLDARDILAAQLSPEGFAASTKRIDHQLLGTTVYLRGATRETFLLPR